MSASDARLAWQRLSKPGTGAARKGGLTHGR